LSRRACSFTLAGVLLDRLLDSVGLEIVPVAVCDLRVGVRMELPPQSEPHVHCVVRGLGQLSAVAGRRTSTLRLASNVVAMVPKSTPHTIEPAGGATRSLKIGGERSSDHVPALSAGTGESALLLVSGLVRTRARTPLGLLDGVKQPVGVDLSDVPRAAPLFEALLAEQVGRPPGSRRMTGLLIQQCLVFALRELAQRPDCPLPWLRGIKDTGLARVLQLMLRAPQRPHTVTALSAAAGMSRSSFSSRFARAFGRSPLDWLAQTRET
jgi:AraC family transcriptional regulator, activator of mtrCDE